MNAWTRAACRALIASALAVALTPAHANMGEEGSGKTDDPNMTAGRRAIDALDWPAAISALKKAVAADGKNADAYNWLGFAYRKQGKMDAAFTAYQEALRLNPGHKAAHEYIGEAYLMTDQPAKAEEHLAELTRLCSPIPCEELKDLKRAIEEYKKARK